MHNNETKLKAIQLRQKGLTYPEILDALNVSVAKSTLSVWFSDLDLCQKAKECLQNKLQTQRDRARNFALQKNKDNRNNYLAGLKKKHKNIVSEISSLNSSLIALSMLYLGEGGKRGGHTYFGNSDPEIITLFLVFLRRCFAIDEKKFRITVQCRADQNSKELEVFWSEISGVPLDQFYATRVDKRSIGKRTKKISYKGVCRIDYFSAEVFNELTIIKELIVEGL
jgi:hypothetical protein